MGMFDSIMVWQNCPYCGEFQKFEAQTKDLDNLMYVYYPYDEDELKLIDRTKIPVFPINPFDKSAFVWKNQDEKMRADASVSDRFKDLEYIEVIAGCSSFECRFYHERESILKYGHVSGGDRYFEGKIKIKDGMLVGKVYDIITEELTTEKELEEYKNNDREKFDRLMKKYKHEPFVTQHWNEKEK